MLGAMRVLTDPAETGAVTIALPQDVQAEAHDWPEELFAKRVWHVPRPVPEPAALARAVAVIRAAERPLLIAGGGVLYSEATDALRQFAEATGIPVADTQAGKGAISWDHPQAVGGVGSTGSPVANALARDADVVIGVGTRYSDFTTASKTAFQNPDVKFVNLNVTGLDAAKHAGVTLVADARAGLQALAAELSGYSVADSYTRGYTEHLERWNKVVDEAYHLDHGPLPAQTEVLGALNESVGTNGTIVQAAGSMPGDLQMLWRAEDPQQYHVEYAFSCMGYEVAGALGIKMAAPEREVYSLVGDGSYLMMAQELVTAVSENIKLIVVIVQNHGFASIGSLSESLGSQRFGTYYRYRDADTGLLSGDKLPIDLAANAESLGADVIRVTGIAEFRKALDAARAATRTTVVHIETDPLAPVPSSESWWDVPVSDVSELRQHAAGVRVLPGTEVQATPVHHPDLRGGHFVSPNVPTGDVSKLVVGTAPDSWGVWFPRGRTSGLLEAVPRRRGPRRLRLDRARPAGLPAPGSGATERRTVVPRPEGVRRNGLRRAAQGPPGAGQGDRRLLP